MFTGIVEEMGVLKSIRKGAHSAILEIQAKVVLKDIHLGDSIAVNGVCLTATSFSPTGFTAHVMHETLNRTSLAGLTMGTPVNLERAMAADGRFGGHIVAGHVDGVGKVIRVRRDDTAIWYTIQAKAELMRYIVEKGSITIDGISLTVAEVGESEFSISAIPHTVSQTILKNRREGDLVNLETDIIGKYVEKLVCPKAEQQPKNTITMDFLSKYGF